MDEFVLFRLTEIQAWDNEHATDLHSRNGASLRCKLFLHVEPERGFREWRYYSRKKIEATPRLAAKLFAIEALIANAPYSFPGINIPWPFSQLILTSAKTIEVR